MKYIDIVRSIEELQAMWHDPATPYLCFGFIEQSLEECVQFDATGYEATYETVVLTEPHVFHRYDPAQSELVEEILAPGEYGIRPNSRRA